MGCVNELLRRSKRQQDTVSNTKRKGVGWCSREGERGRKARGKRGTKEGIVTFRDKDGRERRGRKRGGKGGRRRDILGSDDDATTVPIRHLRETDWSNERRPTSREPRRFSSRIVSISVFPSFFFFSSSGKGRRKQS